MQVSLQYITTTAIKFFFDYKQHGKPNPMMRPEQVNKEYSKRGQEEDKSKHLLYVEERDNSSS